MQQYFYTDGQTQYGPFSLEELGTKDITVKTLVWFEGLSSWKPAGEIQELKSLFGFTPPPVLGEEHSSIANPTGASSVSLPPKSWLVEAILVTLFCCLPFGIAAIVNAAKVESRFYAGDIIGANYASNNARKWIYWAVGTGIVFLACYFYFMFVKVFHHNIYRPFGNGSFI